MGVCTLVMKEKFRYPSLETERIHLEILTLSDAEEVFQHFSDEHVTKFMDIEPCQDVEEAKEIIQFHLDDSGCRWGLFDKNNHAFMGTGGFHCWDKSKAEIGFDLAKSYWGKGYMTEAILAMVKFGFNEMKLECIEATVEPGNFKSIKLMQRLGFEQAKELKENLIYFTLKNKEVQKRETF
jgi:[ribosomal protein S5]-alanine N-acetyltransferase